MADVNDVVCTAACTFIVGATRRGCVKSVRWVIVSRWLNFSLILRTKLGRVGHTFPLLGGDGNKRTVLWDGVRTVDRRFGH